MADEQTTPVNRDIAEGIFSPENIEDHQVKHNHLLAIAVDYYEDEDIANLNNCVNDIEGSAKRDGMIQLLTTYYFFNKENIHFLRSRTIYEDKKRDALDLHDLIKIAAREKEEKGYAFVGEADHRTIIARLKYFAKNITPKDNLIICYSGHGIYDQDFDEGYWIPSDAILRDNASYIENGTIRTALNAISSHHTVLISDSCYSGTLFSTGQTRSLEAPRVYQQPSRWGITAGRKEPVSDGALGENSPFAKLLLDILAQRREVWISDLFSEVSKAIDQVNEKQTPVGEALSFIKGHKNGQFVFLPKMATEKDYWRIAWETNTRKGYFAFLARYPNGEFEEVALEALNVFASGKTPLFNEEALKTYDFISEVLPNQAKSYLIGFLKGTSPAVFSEETLNMYRDWLVEAPDIAKYQLKSFILMGRQSEKQQNYQEKYTRLKADNQLDKKEFFKSLLSGRKNPYKGLNPYTPEDEKMFFGRRNIIKELIDFLKRSQEVPVLLLSGEPRGGKTSVIRAGIFPIFKEQENFELVEVQLEDIPLQQLQKASQGLDQTKKQILLIDRYERLFGENIGRKERSVFENKLFDILDAQKGKNFKLILLINSDSEGEMKASEFGKTFWDDRVINKHLYRLPPPGKEEMREIILGPAWSNFYDFESDELVDSIIEEVRKMPNSLTLLSFVLHRLYSFTLPDPNINIFSKDLVSRAIGNITHALNNFFELKFLKATKDISTKASNTYPLMVKSLFLRMAQVSGGSYSSRRVYMEELEYLNIEDNKVLDSILSALNDAEFIILDKDGINKAYVAPIHDLIISSWKSWRKWIEEFGRKNITLQRDLWEAANKKEVAFSSYSQTEAYSSYWENDPKLALILDHLLIGNTEMLLQEKKSELIKKIEALQNNLPDEELQQFNQLLNNWKANQEPPCLDDFIVTGASDQLLNIFLHHGEHMFNKIEAEFIQKSWEKRSESFTQIFRQRDEAIKAKEAAEKAQQQTIKEVIEASWKAGTLYGTEIVSGDTWIRGVRNLYAKLKLFMSLKKVQSLSPIPIFIKGPHKEDFDVNASEFAYYNPEFLVWAREHMIPAKGNSILRKATQPFYDRFLRDLARVYYFAYQHLEKNPELRDRVKDLYLTHIEGGTIGSGGAFHTNSGGMILQQNLRGYPDRYQSELETQLGSMAFYYWVVASGFWIRRHIDTTATAFMDILEDLLRTYDSDWLENPPQLPG